METIQENSTRTRILQAARGMFAKHGLKSATVRDICKLARANVAAVSYYYGSKEELYAAVLRDHIESMERRHPRDKGVTSGSSAEERLRAFVQSVLYRIVGDGDPVAKQLGRLLAQEVVEPSPHFAKIFEKDRNPGQRFLLDIVRKFLPGADDLTASRCVSSIIGQCVLLDFARDALTRMAPDLELKAENVEEFTDFIVEFSLGGLDRLSTRLAD
jgi:AcrR family transcriptional regulator